MKVTPRPTDRELALKWWSEAWNDGLWAAPWRKSIDDLTARQAAWSPPSAQGVPGPRHSIWQIVLHMVFWRENWLGRLAGGSRPTDDDAAQFNFPAITDISEDAWAAARRRLAESHERIGAALREHGPEADSVMYFLPHDCYHFGQINYLRAMQGLKPIE